MKKRYFVLIGVAVVAVFVAVVASNLFFAGNKEYKYMIYEGESRYSDNVLCVVRHCSSCKREIMIFDRNFYPEKLEFTHNGGNCAIVDGNYVCPNAKCNRYNEEQYWSVNIFRDEILPAGKKYEYEFVSGENVFANDYDESNKLLTVMCRCKFCDRIVHEELEEYEITDKPFRKNKHAECGTFRCYCDYQNVQIWEIDVIRKVV